MDANQIEKLKAEAQSLCAWLRANSSGVYHPAAEAATVIEELIAEVERLRAAGAAGMVEKDAKRWQFFDANAQSTINGRLFAEWLAFDAVMEYGSRVAALDAIAAHTKAGKDNA